ncbi:MAG: hypothetical protein SGBAC_004370 [Bacillariaceae sp.]
MTANTMLIALSSTLNLVSKPKRSDLSTWASLWRDYIPEVVNSKPDVSPDEREKLWKRLSDQSKASAKHMQDLFASFPLPKDSIVVYNQDSYQELISNLVQAQNGDRNFTIVANGGSATAGGGNPSVPQEHRYYYKFAGYLNAILSRNHQNDKPTVQWINQGHGFRTSLHTSIFFDSFIPSDTDLLLWEFSINDPSIGLNKQDLILRSARDSLLTWLHQVKRMKKPPKVVLIYKWDPPFHRDNITQKIASRAFDAHGTMARRFDFVVGHVHVADYIDELQIPDCNTFNKCPILSDHCHISKTGQMVTAFLLLNLLNPNKSSEWLPTAAVVNIDDATYEWSCGVETEAKQILKDVMTTSSKEWRSPLGTWTLELPVIAQGRLVAGQRMGNPHLIGGEDPLRIDRQRAVSVYMCDNADEKGSFSVMTPLEPLTNARVVLLTFKNQDLMNSDSFQVRINGSNETATGELVPVRVKRRADIYWPCHFSCPWGNTVDIYVYVFVEPQAILHSMELCTPTIPIPKPKVQSLAFW